MDFPFVMNLLPLSSEECGLKAFLKDLFFFKVAFENACGF